MPLAMVEKYSKVAHSASVTDGLDISLVSITPSSQETWVSVNFPEVDPLYDVIVPMSTVSDLNTTNITSELVSLSKVALDMKDVENTLHALSSQGGTKSSTEQEMEANEKASDEKELDKKGSFGNEPAAAIIKIILNGTSINESYPLVSALTTFMQQSGWKPSGGQIPQAFTDMLIQVLLASPSTDSTEGGSQSDSTTVIMNEACQDASLLLTEMVRGHDTALLIEIIQRMTVVGTPQSSHGTLSSSHRTNSNEKVDDNDEPKAGKGVGSIPVGIVFTPEYLRVLSTALKSYVYSQDWNKQYRDKSAVVTNGNVSSTEKILRDKGKDPDKGHTLSPKEMAWRQGLGLDAHVSVLITPSNLVSGIHGVSNAGVWYNGIVVQSNSRTQQLAIEYNGGETSSGGDLQMIQVDRFGPCLRNPALPPPEEGESEEEEKSKEVMVEGPYDTLFAQYR